MLFSNVSSNANDNKRKKQSNLQIFVYRVTGTLQFLFRFFDCYHLFSEIKSPNLMTDEIKGTLLFKISNTGYVLKWMRLISTINFSF